MLTKIIFASDYRGIELRENLVKSARKMGINVQDIGIPTGSKIDYIDISKHLSEELRLNRDAIGVMVCGSGQGVAIVLNRFTHIRACVCRTSEDAVQVRKKLNANVLCLGSKQNNFFGSLSILEKFIKTPFTEGKHSLCVKKLDESPTQYNEKGINIIVRAIILHEDHILLTKATDENPYFSSDILFLPGGHVDYNEPCLTALRRELFEEMSIMIESAEFKAAVECSWDRQGSVYHEINMVYQVQIKDLDIKNPPASTEAYQKFVWIPTPHLTQITILPKSLHKVISGVVSRQGKINFHSEMGCGSNSFTSE